jgi:SAM-dependent methyltransferase
MAAIYTAYAPIYQRIKQSAWSEAMARWTLDWLRTHDPGAAQPGRVIDWGCGDGAAALVFAAAGWQVTGIDRSAAMLALAQERTPPDGAQIDWRSGDLCASPELEPGALATALYDTLNYLTSRDELEAGWRSLARSIRPGGYAVADVNTPHEYATTWTGRHVITADSDDILVTNWLRYNQRTRLARGRILWFAREGRSERWRRGVETHRQSAHTDEEMIAAIQKAGLQLIERCTPQGRPDAPDATRLIYIARNAIDG